MGTKNKALELVQELEESVNNPNMYWQGKAAAMLRSQASEIEQWCVDFAEILRELDQLKAKLGRLTVEPVAMDASADMLAADAHAVKSVTCQIYGHVVGTCGECNTHEDADVNATNAVLATRYFELLKKTEDQQVAVPQGWKLVPTEPTPEMIDATTRIWRDNRFRREQFRAMLEAAPQPPQVDAPQVPMTQEELRKAWDGIATQWVLSSHMLLFARSVEAHHGIGVKL